MAKTDKELATELTMAVIKAKADIISSISENSITVRENLINTELTDENIANTFSKFYTTINEKVY